MMDAEELRIGNLINWKDEIEYYVTTIGDSGDICLINNDEVISTELKYCSPIPLTEEWLLKFGFRVMGNNFFIDLDFEVGKRYKKDDLQVWYIDDGIRTLEIELIHVHQLQNLVFALTGEELKNVK